MKTFKTLFFSFLAVAGLASCEKEPDNGNGDTPETEGLTIVAVTDGTLVPEWAAGDVIKVACGDKSYDFAAAAAGKSAQFTGDGSLTAEIIGESPVAAYFNCSSARGAFRISGEQTYKDGKSSASVPMYAYTMNAPQDNRLALTFKPLASVLRVTLPVHPISIEKVIVKAHEGATVAEGAIAGTYTVTASEGTVAVNNDAEMVEMTFDRPMDLTTGGTIDIPVGWFAVEGGLDVTLIYESVKEMTYTAGLEETFKSYNDADGFKASAVVPVAFEMDMNSFPRAYYVTADASATGNGAKWSQPATLDYALEYAMAGSTIHIAAGTYKPTKALPYASEEEIILSEAHNGFEVKRNVTIIGGYPASPAEGAIADASVNKTILDGDGKSWHVMVVGAPKTVGEKVVIEGVTIMNGKNTSDNTYGIIYGTEDNPVKIAGDYAAGLALAGTEVELKNVTITRNSGANAAGLFAVSSKVTMTGCEVAENTSSGNGAGAWFSAGTELIMDGCLIRKNDAGTAIVGGLYLHAPEGKSLSAEVRNTTITENSGANQGGAYVRDDSGAHLLEASFTGCTFSKNTGAQSACLHVLNANVNFTECTFEENKGTGNGIINVYDACTVIFDKCLWTANNGRGTIQHYTANGEVGPALIITNSVFTGNISDQRGACMWLRGNYGSARLVNCTFSGNSAGSLGSVIAANGDIDIDVISCTLSGNRTNNKSHYGAITSEGDATVINLYNIILSGNIRTLDADGNAVESIAETKINKGTFTPKYSFVGAECYGADGVVLTDAPAFDYTTMLGAFDNGVMKLVGTDNPALTYGMPAADLKGLANEHVNAEVLGQDQLGATRNGAVAGACITQ